MDNLIKTSLVPQNNNNLRMKLILLIKICKLKSLFTDKYSDNVVNLTLTNQLWSMNKLHFNYLNSISIFKIYNSLNNISYVFNSYVFNTVSNIINDILVLYNSSWSLSKFKNNTSDKLRFKKSKFSYKFSTNTSDRINNSESYLKKRTSRKRNFLEKKDKKIRYSRKYIFLKKYKEINNLLNYKKLNTVHKLTQSSLKSNFRGRLFFKNSQHLYRKPKLIKDSKVLKGFTWLKTNKNLRSSANTINNIYLNNSFFRKKSIISNLNSLTLLGFNDWIVNKSTDCILFSEKSNISKKNIKKIIAFNTRFLINPSDNLLKLSMFYKLNGINNRSLYLNQKSSLKLSSKRALIFFIRSILNKSLSFDFFTKSKFLKKFIKSSLFNNILYSKHMKFDKKSLLFNLFIQNYLTSKWESRKWKKKKKKKILFRFKKVAVWITKLVLLKKYNNYQKRIDDLGIVETNVKLHSYRFLYRLMFNFIIKSLLKNANIRIRYKKLRYMRLNSLKLNKIYHQNNTNLNKNNNIEYSNDLINLHNIDIKELIHQFEKTVLLKDLHHKSSSFKSVSLNRFLKNLIIAKKYNKEVLKVINKKNLNIKLLNDCNYHNVSNIQGNFVKSNRLDIIKLIKFNKKKIKINRLRLKKKYSLKKSPSLKRTRTNSNKFNKYKIASYKLFYMGRVFKRKSKKILIPIKPNKFKRSIFKKLHTKKKIRYRRELPVFKPSVGGKVPSRFLFLNKMHIIKTKNKSNIDLNSGLLFKKNIKKIKQSLPKSNYLKQKRFLLRKKKMYSDYLVLSNLYESKSALYTNSLIRRTNTYNVVKSGSTKATYIKDLFLRPHNRQINQELSKLINLGNNTNLSKKSVYTDFIYKNIINSKNSSNIDKFTINFLKSNTRLPGRVFNRIFYIKKKTILFFRRRKLLNHYIKQLATTRWSFKMSRLKKLVVTKLKLSKIPSIKNKINSSKTNTKDLLDRVVNLKKKSNKNFLKKTKKKLNKILNKKSIKNKFIFKKRNLIKRFFIKSPYLRLINNKRFKKHIKVLIKKYLFKNKEYKRRESKFKLPSYLKNTRLLSKLCAYRWIRNNQISRPAFIIKRFFRLRRSKKKKNLKKKIYSLNTPLYLQKKIGLLIFKKFKKTNNKLSYSNKLNLIKNKKWIKKKKIKHNYTSTPFLNKSNLKLKLHNRSKLINISISKLSKCPIRTRGKTKKKYFLNALNMSSKTDTRTSNVSHSSLYRLLKPYRRHFNWSNSNLLKRKLRKVKHTFLKTKKNPNVNFYTKLIKKKRQLNLKFLNSIKNLNTNIKFFKKKLNHPRLFNNTVFKSNITNWFKSILLKKKLKTNFKKTNFKKTNFKKTNFKKTNFKKTNFKKTNFKKTNKHSIFKKYSNSILKSKLGRSFFKKFAIRSSVSNQIKFYNTNLLSRKYLTNNLYYCNVSMKLNHSYKDLLMRIMNSYNNSNFYKLPTVNNYKQQNYSNSIGLNISPLSLQMIDVYFDIELQSYNQLIKDVISYVDVKEYYNGLLTCSSNKPYTYLNNSITSNFMNIQTIRNQYGLYNVIDTGLSKAIENKFTKFVLKYFKLSKKLNNFNYKHTNVINLCDNLLYSSKDPISLNSPLKNLTTQCVEKPNKSLIMKKPNVSYTSVRFNSYNHLFNLISSQVYNNNLIVLSIDLLKYSLNTSQVLNQVSTKISDILKFEFSKIAPTFFIDEAISLILTSIRFKDTNLFMTWFTRFMYKLPIKKHKRAIAFLTKLFKLVYFNNFNNKLYSLGVYFDIRGKVGVTGSKKKRHNAINLGKYSSTNKSLKWVTQKGTVVTSTGVLGVTFSIFY